LLGRAFLRIEEEEARGKRQEREARSGGAWLGDGRVEHFEVIK
jgi:hypothetical protein